MTGYLIEDVFDILDIDSEIILFGLEGNRYYEFPLYQRIDDEWIYLKKFRYDHRESSYKFIKRINTYLKSKNINIVFKLKKED